MNRIDSLATLSVCALCLGYHRADAFGDEKPEPAIGEYRTIYEAGVRVRIPVGFEELGRPGFQHPENGCLIMAHKVAAAFTEDFENHAKSLREGKILERTRVKIGDMRGLLIHLEKPPDLKDADRSLTNWNLVFGDDKTSWIVSGTYFRNTPPEYRELLKSVVLSAQVDNSPPPKPGARQSFTLTIDKLKLVEVSWKHLTFTEDGEVPTKSVSAPIFFAGNFPLKADSERDKRAFAETSLKREPGVTKIDIHSISKIVLDGVDGYELVADGIHVKSGKPVKLYYVVLFDAKEYVMLSGYCGADVSEKYVPEFKAMAASFKRKTK